VAFVLVSGKEYKDKTFEITGGRLTIGRSLDCDIILRDDQVSSHHSQVIYNDRVYWLQDLGSTNGTQIKGKRIIQQRLESGDEFTVTGYTLTFSDTDTFLAEKEAASIEDVRRWLHEQLIEELNLKKLSLAQMADRALRTNASDVLDRLIQQKRRDIPREFDIKSIKKAVLDAALGLGPLEDMLADEKITEIMVNGPNRIFVEESGRLRLSNKSFLSKREILTAIERIVGPIGRRIDESSPMVDARLSDGSRVNAIIPPLALDSPTITIRKFPTKRFGMDDYLRYGSLTKPMIDFLRVCVIAAKNMIISGGTGSGKTTMLNVLSSFIPEGDRILTIEDSAELRLPQMHVVRMETRPSNVEGKGEVTIRDLVRNALRMRPNRIVVGECRGGEALDMLQAMNTGHDGSLTTVHANTPSDALRRLENLVLMAGLDLPLRAVRELIASAVHVVVQISRFSDGTRKVTAISEVNDLYDGEFQMQDIFTFRRTGISPEGRVRGVFSATGVIPAFLDDLMQAGMDVDMSIFVPVEEESGS